MQHGRKSKRQYSTLKNIDLSDYLISWCWWSVGPEMERAMREKRSVAVVPNVYPACLLLAPNVFLFIDSRPQCFFPNVDPGWLAGISPPAITVLRQSENLSEGGGVPLKPHFLTAPVIPRVYCLICNQVD